MKLTAKTLYGLEDMLAKELTELGASDIEPVNRAVLFNGTLETLYRVNYCSRTALSVLMPLSEFTIRSGDDLYKSALKIKWTDYMDVADTFSVIPVVNSKLFGHTGYPALVVKDAIADFFRNKKGRRPSVDLSDPAIIINLHISNDRVNISLDSSGLPLFMRGYRVIQGDAPLNEVLAAGIIHLSGWNGSDPLLDPMCGSGTIPIEAGLIACNIPPGRFRNHFGFFKWKNYDSRLFKSIKEEADRKIICSPVKITAGDISNIAVKQCNINIKSAGLQDMISVEVSDFKNLKAGLSNGYLIINPPYGKRIRTEDMGILYNMIGTTLKYNFAGNKAWILTAGKENLDHIGLKTVKRYKLFNGAIECILAGYEIYEGSRKVKK